MTNAKKNRVTAGMHCTGRTEALGKYLLSEQGHQKQEIIFNDPKGKVNWITNTKIGRKELKIEISDENGYQFTFYLVGAYKDKIMNDFEGNIVLGEYPNESRNTGQFCYFSILKDGGKVTQVFEERLHGDIVLEDYGNSSNILCGKFLFTSDEFGYWIKGSFYEEISSF